MAIYFRAADRREVSAREALDERGILRHGYGQRVSHHAMRDAAPRFAWDAHRASDSLLVTDARRIGGVEGCRPGYRISDDDAGRQACVDARAAYIWDLENAWRNPPRDAAKKKEDPPVTGRSRCPECDGSGVVHGKTCQGCGGDGWVDDDDNNEDDDDNNNKESAASDRRMLDVQAVSAAHQQNMAKIYQQIADDLSQQWRER